MSVGIAVDELAVGARDGNKLGSADIILGDVVPAGKRVG